MMRINFKNKRKYYFSKICRRVTRVFASCYTRNIFSCRGCRLKKQKTEAPKKKNHPYYNKRNHRYNNYYNLIISMVTVNLSISIILFECIISLVYGFNSLLNLKGRTLLRKFHLYSADTSIIDRKKNLVLGLNLFFSRDVNFR